MALVVLHTTSSDPPLQVVLTRFLVESLDGVAQHGPGHVPVVPAQKSFLHRNILLPHLAQHPPDGLVHQVLVVVKKLLGHFQQFVEAPPILWAEASPSEKVGIDIPTDGSDFQRLCAKMAMGSGKTVVMAMIIAWHILNKVASPQDRRFAKNILVIAPGLTVKNRLAVLQPSHPENYYKAFRILPYAG